MSKVTHGEQQQVPFSTLKPIMVYDGACNFCRYWVSKWQRHASDEVIFIPYQQLPNTYFGVTRQQFSKSVYLITQYRRLRGAAAVFEMLALGGNDFWNRLYHNVILADTIFEAGYWLVATFRNFFFRVIKLFSKEARELDIPPFPTN